MKKSVFIATLFVTILTLFCAACQTAYAQGTAKVIGETIREVQTVTRADTLTDYPTFWVGPINIQDCWNDLNTGTAVVATVKDSFGLAITVMSMIERRIGTSDSATCVITPYLSMMDWVPNQTGALFDWSDSTASSWKYAKAGGGAKTHAKQRSPVQEQTVSANDTLIYPYLFFKCDWDSVGECASGTKVRGAAVTVGAWCHD